MSVPSLGTTGKDVSWHLTLAKTHSQLTMPMLLGTSNSVESSRKVSTLGPSYWPSMVLGPTVDPLETEQHGPCPSSPVKDTYQYNGNGELSEQLEELFNPGQGLVKVSQTKEPLGQDLKDGS